jgi:hypothetical protein
MKNFLILPLIWEIQEGLMDKKESEKLSFAKESDKTRKARMRLKEYFDLIDKHITPDILGKKRMEIQKWLAKHASEKTVLSKKNICLFDGNKNAAKSSPTISKVFSKVKKSWDESLERSCFITSRHSEIENKKR